MKKFVIITLILSFPVLLQAQSCSIRRMFRSYDPGKEVTRIHIPSCLTCIGSWFIDEPETKHLLRQLKSVYVLASEDETFAKESDFPRQIARRLKNRNFEEMMAVKSEGDNINMLVRDKGKKKEYVIAVDGDEDVLVYIRSKLSLAELAEFGDLGLKGVKLDEVLKEI